MTPSKVGPAKFQHIQDVKYFCHKLCPPAPIAIVLTLKRQLHKMVKHTQTIRGQQPTNCLSVFDHFMGLMSKGLKFFLYCSLITSHLFLEFDRNIFYEMGELGLLGATINGKPLFVGNNAKR